MTYKLLVPQAIVIHCAATKPSMDIGAKEIDRWHRTKGWLTIGYHYVIRRDGVVEKGRPDTRMGAHARYHNHYTLGICLVGGINEHGKPENNFTPEQWLALTELLTNLVVEHKTIDAIVGHNELTNVRKACPSFSVGEWLKPIASLQALLDENHLENKYYE